MAKFTWSIETDDAKEAIRINEEMAAMVYRVNNKRPAEATRAKPDQGEFQITNPITKASTRLKTDPKNIRLAIDDLLGWIDTAKATGDLSQLLLENQEFIRTLTNSKEKKKIHDRAARREEELLAEGRRLPSGPAPVATSEPPPTQVELDKAFRLLFDAYGADACQEVLKALNVPQLKALKSDMWSTALTAIQSVMVARGAAPR